MQLIWQAKGTAYIGANLPIFSGNIVYFSEFKFKIVFSLAYILIILTLTRKRFDIVLACASCFNSQMGCSSGYVASALGPLPPGLVRSGTVAHDSSTTPADLLGLSCRFLYVLFFGFNSLLWNRLKGSDSLIVRLSFPFLILWGSVLAHTIDTEPWAPTHKTTAFVAKYYQAICGKEVPQVHMAA